MRVFIVRKGSDLQAVGAELLRSDATDPAREEVAIDRIRELNPHVDFQRLESGTVLLLPETAELRAGAGESVGGEAFDGFVGEVHVGLENSGDRIKQGYARIADDRKAVSAALRSAAMKRVVEGDPTLKAQLESADAALREEVRRGTEAQEALAKAQAAALQELADLKRLFE